MKRNHVFFALSALLSVGFAFSAFAPAISMKTAAALEEDNVIVTTYQDENRAINAPTVVVDAWDKETLDKAISSKETPSNVILHVDGVCDVVDILGESIGSFHDIYKSLKNKILPIAYVSDEAGANALVDYLTDSVAVLDMAVMSEDPALIAKVKETLPTVRGILDATLAEEEGPGLVLKAQEAQAMTIVLDQHDARTETVSYLQGMFKTVWVSTYDTLHTTLADATFSGAYGLITSDAQAVYAFYDTLPQNTYTRAPFIVGHRGDPQNSHENSLSGTVSAIANGATHIELDVHVTADKKLVIIHDTTLTAASNGTGTVANMTLAQIQAYQLDINKNVAPEKIPTLEECITGILEHEKQDAIFILELKCKGLEVVTLVRDAIYNDPDLTPILDRLVVITFYADQLAEMKRVMPEVPTSYLATATSATMPTLLEWMGDYNCGIDTSNGNITASFQHMLKDRGIIDWSYTYSTFNDALAAQKRGVIGITTNQPSEYANVVKNVSVREESMSAELQVGDEVDVNVVTFKGESSLVKGKIAYVDEDLLAYYAVASVEIDGYTYFTQWYMEEKPTLLYAGVGGAAAVLLVIVIAVAAGGKKRKAKKAEKAAKNAKTTAKKRK